MSESVNPKLTAVEDIFKGGVWNPIENAAKAALFVEVPWLKIWPLGPLVSYALDRYSEKVFNGFRTDADVAAIQLLNQSRKLEFVQASVKLKILALDKGANSPEFQKAKDDAIAAIAQFGSYNK